MADTEALYGLVPATASVLSDVADERAAQDTKWGEQNHEPLTWLAVLSEEVGEVAQAMLKYTFTTEDSKAKHLAAYREECIQVAAVAVAMVEALDRGKWKDGE